MKKKQHQTNIFDFFLINKLYMSWIPHQLRIIEYLLFVNLFTV